MAVGLGSCYPTLAMVITRTELATFGGGCFWCTEAVFRALRGVTDVQPGYAGGSVPNPSYEQVCSGSTGHAEAIQITFDGTLVTFHDLLAVFFATHDPTTRNRQDADVGTQYRSAIFYHSEEQEQQAAAFMAELTNDGTFAQPILTELTPFTSFYPAEDHHQRYFERNSDQPYCAAVINPKLAKLRATFAHLLAEPSS